MTELSLEFDRDVLAALRNTPELLRAVAGQAEDELRLQQRLRERFDAELVRAAFQLRELRERGKAKFSRSDQMWFDRLGLEQATSEVVARHKAQRFHGTVWDFCCGIGGDAIGLASRCQVVAVDRCRERCLMTAWNAETYEVADRVTVVQGDVRQLLDPQTLLHLDPDRRTGGGYTPDGRRRRTLSLEQYEPGYAFLRELTRRGRGGMIKVGPAANFLGRFPGTEIELVSLHRECKEARIWYGELAGNEPFRATVLPSGATLAADPDSAVSRVGSPGAYVYDPDPAVVRAGLVDVLAEQLGLWRLDESEEYLTSDRRVDSPFLRPFAVREIVANNERAVRKAFRKFACREIEVKSRHIPVNADAVRRKLPRDGNHRGVVIFTRINGKARAVIGERLD